MVKLGVLSTCLVALAGLAEAFDKYPRGAVLVGSLVAMGMICQTIVSLRKKQD